VLLPPGPLIVTELKIGDRELDNLALVWMLMVAGEDCASTYAGANRSVPDARVAPPDEVPGSPAVVTVQFPTHCAGAVVVANGFAAMSATAANNAARP
jgi:hypothetical protein